MIQCFFIFTIILSLCLSLDGRNVRRPIDQSIPSITVSSTDPEFEKSWIPLRKSTICEKKSYTLKSSFLRLNPIMRGFDVNFFKQFYLPQGQIKLRNQPGFINSKDLSNLASELIEKIKIGHRKFKHFIILKDKDFNYKTLSGLIILKFKDYPFVIKLSIEHPYTMVRPYSKNYQTDSIFVMGGNLRHLSNFTRISNLERIKNILKFNPFYLQSLNFPRKWYWKPDRGSHDLKITWSCAGNTKEILLPCVYATISDFIDTTNIQPQQELNKLAMQIAIDTGFLIDPHAGNLVLEKNTNRYALIDTEDFRMMLGLNKSMRAKKYIGWYIEMIGNFLNVYCCRSKSERSKQCQLI